MRSAHGFFLDTVYALVSISMHDLPTLENFICDGVDLLFQILKQILLPSSKLHCLCTILGQIFSLVIYRGGGEFI